MDTLGIDVGTTTVKYVRYRKKADRILSHGEYRYRRGWEELKDILSAIKDKEGTNVALAVGITSVDLLKKTFSIPMIPEEETKAEVDALVSKGTLVPTVDMRRQYLILGQIQERGTAKRDVLFVGAHRSFVDHVVGLFHRTGFKKLLVLTDVGFSYQVMPDCPLDGAVAVIDIGGRQTGIYVIDSGKLLLTREIMTACETLKDAIVGGTALSPDESEEQLWIRGFDDEYQALLALPFERLAAQIQRTFLVHANKYPTRPVVKAWVSGRGANIPGLPEKLTELLGQPFDVISSLAEVDRQYIPAYALATRGDRFPNLLTHDKTGTRRQESMIKYARVAGIAIIAGIVFFSVAAWLRLNYLNTAVDNRLAMLTQKMQQLPRQTRSLQPLSGLRQPSQKEIGQKEGSFILLLKVLSSHLPPQVYLSSIEFRSAPAALCEASVGDTGKSPQDYDKRHRAGFMHLQGYITAEGEEVEPVLMQVMVNLEKSGLLRNVRVDGKGMRNVKGKMVVEFVASGECQAYEI